MAADLSGVTPRVTQQDRITRNRDRVLPRRNTEAAQRRVFGDIRNASRGDGGADALRQALGLVQNAAGDFQTYSENKFKVDEAENSAQGSIDEAAGHADAARMEKSKAYREAVTLSRTQRDWATGLSDLERGLQELVNNQDNPDPAAREAEVAEYLEKHNAGFAVGEDGQLKDFGSPGANRWLAEQMGVLRANTLAKASSLIEARMGDESVNNMASTARAQIVAGQDVDYGSLLKTLLPTVDPKVGMKALVTSVKAAVGELEETDPVRGRRILDGLLGWAKKEAAVQAVNVPPSNVAGEPGAAPAAASLVTPFAGFSATNVRSRIGEARAGSTHNGEDFPTPVGTPIVAPMGGEVVGSYRNDRGGHQVRVKLDNGAIVGFAHLSSRGVKAGQRVEAGAQLGLSGNTGKSTGPHVHMTMEVGGKKVSPSEYFKSNPTAPAARPAGPPMDPSLLDPATPSEQADAAGAAQLTAPTGPMTLSPAEIVDIQEFRRSYSNRINAKAEAERNEAQAVAYGELVARANGVGSYPTPSEIQEKMRAGEIAPQMGAALLNTMDSDARADRQEAREVASLAKQDATEGKIATVDRVVNGVVSDVAAGRLTVTEANKRLADQALTIADRETRQAVISSGQTELTNVQQLRTRGPEYVRADSQFRQWSETYVQSLSKVRLPRGVTREQAAAKVKGWMDEYVALLARGDIRPEAVGHYMDRAEKDLDRRFRATFPPRAASK